MTSIPTINKSLENIIGQLRQELPRLREEYAVDTLAIFGSYARNTQHPTSDIDILVSFRITPGLLKYISLEQDLSDLLGISVDLVMERALKPEIAIQVASDKKDI